MCGKGSGKIEKDITYILILGIPLHYTCFALNQMETLSRICLLFYQIVGRFTSKFCVDK